MTDLSRRRVLRLIGLGAPALVIAPRVLLAPPDPPVVETEEVEPAPGTDVIGPGHHSPGATSMVWDYQP